MPGPFPAPPPSQGKCPGNEVALTFQELRFYTWLNLYLSNGSQRTEMAVTDFSFATCTVTLAALVTFGFFSFSLYVLYQHWRYRHIPGPARDGFFTGNVPFIRKEKQRNPAGMTVISYNWYREYGSVYVMWIYHIPVVMLSDPDAAKKALVTLNLPKAHRVYSLLSYLFGQRALGRSILTEIDHEVWSRKRNMLNPAFHRKYLMNLMDAFNSVGDEFLEKLSQLADRNTPVKMADEFARVTLDIIGKVGKVCTRATDEYKLILQVAG